VARIALAAAGAQVLVHVKEADGVVTEIRFCAGGRAMKRTSHRYSCDFRYWHIASVRCDASIRSLLEV
jgi:hypothetical protein